MNDVAHRRGKWRRNWAYWVRGAAVYPDGTVDEWSKEHKTHGYVTMPPVNDDGNANGRYWSGHTQSHCGEHIYVSGTDKDAVDAAFLRDLATVVGRQTGKCREESYQHKGVIDGETVYATGFMSPPRRAVTGGPVEVVCMGCYAEHDWGEWSEWREVQPEQFNRQRICGRCSCVSIAHKSTYTFAAS